MADVLADPKIQGHTEKILALQKEERQARSKLGGIIAAIGAELIAVKEALDKLSAKTAWLRWLKNHVHYSADTAERYMLVSRFSKKFRSAAEFFEMDPTVLYRVAALPDEIATTLTPDTLLTDPRTERQVPLKDLSTRSLDRALDALEGRKVPEKMKSVPVGVVLSGGTREEFASDTQRIMSLLSAQLAEIKKRNGSLTGNSKQRVLDAIEGLRRIVLKWPAWATPAAAKARAARRQPARSKKKK